MYAQYILTQNILKREVLGSRFKDNLKFLWNNFSVSTLNSIGGVLCSVTVSERLKMRKSLAINYWQDTISGVEVSSNVRNINKLWGVSTSSVIFTVFYFTLFFFFYGPVLVKITQVFATYCMLRCQMTVRIHITVFHCYHQQLK